MNWDQNAAKSGIKALQDYAVNTQPAEMNLRILLNGYSLTLNGVYYGNQSSFSTATSQLFSAMGVSGSPSQSDWISGLTTFAYGQLSTSFDYDQHESFVSLLYLTWGSHGY